jgi:folate-binding protein YgfZ
MAATLHPAEAPAASSSPAAELSAILTGAAFAQLNDTGWLRITGPDAARWLNGMVTNAVQALAPGEGCYNFLLNAQGRILGDCTIYRDPRSEPPAFLLETDASQLDAIQNHLDRFIIMDDVELSNVTTDRVGLLLAGPRAESILQRLRISAAQSTAISIQSAPWNKNPLDILCTNAPLVPTFELWSDLTTILELDQALASAGAVSISPSALEALRILEGTPRYSTDIRNTDKAHDLPQETAQTRALNFSKGCYLGQEIVERIHSRGSVHRTFTGFLLIGALPAPGVELTVESAPRPVGELTSVASIPNPAKPDSPPLQLALGYIRRDALQGAAPGKNLPLHYPGGTATPAALPFAIP